MKNDGGHSMKLTLEGIKNREAWEKAGIRLPGYDGYTLELVIYSVSSSAESQMDFWKKARWTEVSPV